MRGTCDYCGDEDVATQYYEGIGTEACKACAGIAKREEREAADFFCPSNDTPDFPDSPEYEAYLAYINNDYGIRDPMEY